LADALSGGIPEEPKKTVRFLKMMAPAQPVLLQDGRSVSFRLVKSNTGGYLRHSVFETDDESLINGLRQLSKIRSQQVVEE
jgi:hypothetical protein